MTAEHGFSLQKYCLHQTFLYCKYKDDTESHAKGVGQLLMLMCKPGSLQLEILVFSGNGQGGRLHGGRSAQIYTGYTGSTNYHQCQGVDTCKGDGGSPLTCRINGSNRWVQVNLT